MQESFTHEQLLDCGHGRMFGPGNAQLPLPPMLMFDRIVHVCDEGGEYGKGEIVAELDLNPDLWFFQCHFENDPVMPGCLGVDALWQLVGFFLGWRGGQGHGRALGSGEIRFTGQVTRRLYMGIADGYVEVDDRTIYTGRDLRVGLFNAEEGGTVA